MSGSVVAQQHDHVITFTVTTGPLLLWMLALFGGVAVAGFGVMRPFLGAPGRAVAIGVTATAAATGLLQLLVTTGLDLPRQFALLLLLALAVPVLVARQQDPRFDRSAHWARRAASSIVLLAALGAGIEFARAWAGLGDPVVLLHTGLVIALAGLSWFVIGNTGSRRVTAGVYVVVWLLANAATAAAVHVAVLSAVPA